MTTDKWLDLKGLIETKFEIEDQGEYFSEEHGGTKTEYLVFESRLGRIKLEFVIKPKIKDKTVSYSNRIGSNVEIEYQYSETEKNSQLFVYRWSEDSDEWSPLSAENYNFI